MISTLSIIKVAELFYPIMLTQEMGEISEAKACELLGMNIEKYRETKGQIAQGVLMMLDRLPSPLILLLETIPGKPGL